MNKSTQLHRLSNCCCNSKQIKHNLIYPHYINLHNNTPLECTHAISYKYICKHSLGLWFDVHVINK